MHKKYLDFLVDPETRDKFELKITKSEGDFVIEGELVSPSNRYPIRNGVPRFVKNESYTSSFGWQWNKWSRVQFDSDNVGGPMEGYTRKMWERIAGTQEDLKGKVVLDIGCGPGRFIDVVKAKGATVVGIDYSEAVDAARKNFPNDETVLIVQADALKLPFRDAIFDCVYSIGVLHHTPSPSKGVAEAHRTVKSGGWVAICVYSKGGYYDFPPVQFWRKIFKFLWPLFGHWPPLLYSQLTTLLFGPIANVSRPLGLPIKVIFPFVNLPDRRWSLLDTFDSVTPSYQSTHESFEVFSWFKTLNFKQMEPTNWSFTSYKGIK